MYVSYKNSIIIKTILFILILVKNIKNFCSKFFVVVVILFLCKQMVMKQNFNTKNSTLFFILFKSPHLVKTVGCGKPQHTKYRRKCRHQNKGLIEFEVISLVFGFIHVSVNFSQSCNSITGVIFNEYVDDSNTENMTPWKRHQQWSQKINRKPWINPTK